MQVGLVGWRGMVGSVLMQRMIAEKDFKDISPVFFSTSQAGQVVTMRDGREVMLKDANDQDQLSEMDAIISCQGGAYTKKVHAPLRKAGWEGYWIDAASTLRMAPNSVIVLDPINGSDINTAIDEGKKDFIGGNCTTSLMMLAMHGLFRDELVEWVSAMTYQAASGAGAQNMRELIEQMGSIHEAAKNELASPEGDILEIDALVLERMRAQDFPSDHFGVPLAGSLIPWIDADLGNGQSREEWKAQAETNKILGRQKNLIPVESICVRVGAMRCHSQALTFKLSESLPALEVEKILSDANKWVSLVPNDKLSTVSMLSPTSVTQTLSVPVGRIRKLNLPGNIYSAFTVGDQLLWGAAEPLRRMLRILIDRDG
jgi:aspartate-semialdehyde dehydrogenase